MGACASKPKTKDILPASIPSEAPESFKKAEGEAVAAVPETNNGAEAQKEDPSAEEPSKPVVEAVEVVNKEAEDQSEQMAAAIAPVEVAAALTPVEVAASEKQETACKTEVDEGKEAVVEPIKQEVADVKAETKEPEATPSSGPKTDAPLITTTV